MLQLLLSILLLYISPPLSHQTDVQDQVVGQWENEEKDSKIEIYKVGEVYSGKVTWSKSMFESDGETIRKDENNPNDKLRTRSLLNLVILNEFVFDDGIWDDGKMYDPKSGKTYSCHMKIRGNTLEIRSYVGISLFGRSTYWQKSE